MAIVAIGIDLAKNVFAVHDVDEAGKPALVRPEVARAKLLELIADLPPCLIGMDTCSCAHHWAREFVKLESAVVATVRKLQNAQQRRPRVQRDLQQCGP